MCSTLKLICLKKVRDQILWFVLNRWTGNSSNALYNLLMTQLSSSLDPGLLRHCTIIWIFESKICTKNHNCFSIVECPHAAIEVTMWDIYYYSLYALGMDIHIQCSYTLQYIRMQQYKYDALLSTHTCYFGGGKKNVLTNLRHLNCQLSVSVSALIDHLPYPSIESWMEFKMGKNNNKCFQILFNECFVWVSVACGYLITQSVISAWGKYITCCRQLSKANNTTVRAIETRSVGGTH